MGLLEINDLHVYYSNIHAIKGVSLEVNKGEIVCLIGANGAGKTTVLQSISGLVPVKSGSISFKKRDILKDRAHKICSLGIAQVPEGRRIFSNMTVEDNIELGFFSSKKTSQEKKQLKELFFENFPRIKERIHQIAGTLSGGEQQMLAIGRALMSEPELLIMDEPSMGLSPLFVTEIFNTIKRLNSEGVTILLVEQNAHLALEVANRGYVLETGLIKLSGTASDLMNNPKVKQAYLGI